MTSKTHFEIVEIEKTNVMVDVSLIENGVMWFNATQIAKPFKKLPADFLRLESTGEYIDEIFKDGISHIKNLDDLVIIKRGKFGGTWLHRELAFEFAGWCSALFRRKLHKWAEQRLSEERIKKQSRLEAKTGYLPMSRAIKEAHDPIQFYHFSNEADMINRIVLGMSSKRFRKENDVKNVRDALSAYQLQAIDRLQRINTGLIEVGLDFETRKEMLLDNYHNKLALAAA